MDSKNLDSITVKRADGSKKTFKRSDVETMTMAVQQKLDKALDEQNEKRDELVRLTSQKEAELRGSGGYITDVYQIFGIENTGTINLQKENGKAKKFITDESNWDKYVFGASTKGEKQDDIVWIDEELGIVEWHAYSISPYKNKNGDVRFKITNPWNTGEHFDLSYSEFSEKFSWITYGKIS